MLHNITTGSIEKLKGSKCTRANREPEGSFKVASEISGSRKGLAVVINTDL